VSQRRLLPGESTQNIRSTFESIVRSADVDTVFGDPIERGEVTIVPVARVSYGMGFGFGSSEGGDGVDIEFEDDETEMAEDGAETSEEPGAESSRGSGAGGGGGVLATPVGVVEVSPAGTTFRRFDERGISLRALALGAVLGFVAARGLTRKRGD
jgi:uncharacterized spore protein YtfJ